MKRQIRKGAFETNSSSTHAINIYRSNNYNIPKSIVIKPGEFGWEHRIYDTPEDKLSYLYTLCLVKCAWWEVNEITGKWEERYDYIKKKDYQYRIKSQLEAAGVEEIEFASYDDGYIDHDGNIDGHDIETIIDSYFLDFVFGDDSFIETGNDNDDNYCVSEDYRADFSIYKGN